MLSLINCLLTMVVSKTDRSLLYSQTCFICYLLLDRKAIQVVHMVWNMYVSTYPEMQTKLKTSLNPVHFSPNKVDIKHLNPCIYIQESCSYGRVSQGRDFFQKPFQTALCDRRKMLKAGPMHLLCDFKKTVSGKRQLPLDTTEI